MSKHVRYRARWVRVVSAAALLSVAASGQAQALPPPLANAGTAKAATFSGGCPTTLTLSPRTYLREREVVRQTLRVDDLRSTRRRWQPAAVTFGLGVTSLALGAVFLRHASRIDVYKPAMEGAGVIMMPLGALMMLVAGPLLGIRASRTLRLARAERALELAIHEPASP